MNSDIPALSQRRSPFNLLCRLAERYLSDRPRWRGFADQLRSIHLFTMPGDPKTFLPQGYTEDEQEFFTEHFFLPFDDIALEDDLGVVTLTDLEPNQKGLGTHRHFTMMAPTPQSDGVLVVSGLAYAQIAGNHLFGTSVSPSYATLIFDGSGEAIDFDMQTLGADQQLMLECSQNVGTAIQEVMLLNTPSHFIIEEAPAKPPKKQKKIPRKEDRPVYTLLKPDAVRRILVPECGTATDTPPTERTSPSPHLRRRHYRTLRSDRFTGKKGQLVEVKAAWVGPEERIVGGKRYRIRLDL